MGRRCHAIDLLRLLRLLKLLKLLRLLRLQTREPDMPTIYTPNMGLRRRHRRTSPSSFINQFIKQFINLFSNQFSNQFSKQFSNQFGICTPPLAPRVDDTSGTYMIYLIHRRTIECSCERRELSSVTLPRLHSWRYEQKQQNMRRQKKQKEEEVATP